MKLDLKQFEAIVFDIDGTMVDNMTFHSKAWIEFIRRHGFKLDEEEFLHETLGEHNDEIFDMLFERDVRGEEFDLLDEEKEAIYREMYAPHFKEVPGLKDFLNQLKQTGIKIGVATTAPFKNRVFILETLELMDFFPVVVGGEHVSHGKPHPQTYLLAAKGLGIDPKKCLAFEDTPSGVKSAKSAGMTVIGVLTTQTEKDLKEADYFIRDYKEIELIKRRPGYTTSSIAGTSPSSLSS